MEQTAAVSKLGYDDGVELHGSRYNGGTPAMRCLFCIVWVGVIYRGRTVPVAWRVVTQSSSTVRLWTIQRVLRQATRVIPTGVEVVLLADRGFADGKLMKYLQETLEWHFRIRIKRNFYFEYQGQWQAVGDVALAKGQSWFAQNVRLGKTKPYGM